MSAGKNLMRTLADARPDRLDPGPGHRRPDPAAIMAHARPAEGTRPARRPVRRLILVGAVPVVAAIAAGVVFLASSEVPAGRGGATAQSGSATESPAGAPASARELLLVAAERSATTAATGRYLVVTQEDGDVRPEGPAGRRYNIVRRTSFERWYPTTPGGTGIEFHQSLGAKLAGPQDEAAWRADGSPTRWVEPAPKDLPGAEPVVITSTPGPRSFGQFAARELLDGSWYATAKLPAEPAALRRYLLARWKDTSGEKLSDFELFRSGTDIVLNPMVRAEVRAAAFRMLAGIDGVTSLGQVTDQSGRAGVAVGYARKGDSGNWSQPRLIIDPRTGQPLAQESWNLGPGKTAAASGELLGYTLMTGTRYTDDAPPIESATPRGPTALTPTHGRPPASNSSTK